MKCPAYKTPYCKSDGQPCAKRVDCRHGWLPFWSESERAGLKAMGAYIMAARCYRADPLILAITKGKPLTRAGEERTPSMKATMDTIRAFVSAARAAKEGR